MGPHSLAPLFISYFLRWFDFTYSDRKLVKPGETIHNSKILSFFYFFLIKISGLWWIEWTNGLNFHPDWHPRHLLCAFWLIVLRGEIYPPVNFWVGLLASSGPKLADMRQVEAWKCACMFAFPCLCYRMLREHIRRMVHVKQSRAASQLSRLETVPGQLTPYTLAGQEPPGWCMAAIELQKKSPAECCQPKLLTMDLWENEMLIV